MARTKGSVNLHSIDFKKKLAEWQSAYLTADGEDAISFDNDFRELDPRDRVAFLEKTLKYSIPAMQAVQMDMAAQISASGIESKLEELSKVTRKKDN